MEDSGVEDGAGLEEQAGMLRPGFRGLEEGDSVHSIRGTR